MSSQRIALVFTLCLLAFPIAAQDAKPLENQDVIRLTRAGLSEDLIIAKIKSSPTNFDTSTDGIMQLKQAGVKDRVLAIMLDGVGKPATTAVSVSNSDAASPKKYPEELGAFVNQDGKWNALPTEKAEWKTGGGLKAMGRIAALGGTIGVDVDVYVTGPTSSLTATRKAEFLLYVAEGDVPTAYQLVKLTQKKDRREFKISKSGWFSVKNGPGKAAVPFEANKVSVRTYLIKLELEPGEYCFFKAAGAQTGDSGLVYSFKVV